MRVIIQLVVYLLIGFLIFTFIKQQRENKTKEPKEPTVNTNYRSLFIVCFVIPFFGFLSGVIHIDTNNILARKCIKYACYGILAEIIIAFIIGLLIEIA